MTRIERITRMEQHLDAAAEAVAQLHAALDRYASAREHLRILADYYDGAWRKDYEADEAGKLPDGLKRGVLSQDALYDLLCDNEALIRRMADLGSL